MYKVIGHPQSRTLRVMWTLEELGAAYTLDPARPGSDAIREINPSGKIPALIDDGEVLYDSVAICTYLADKHGKLTFAAGTINRARQDSFTQFCVDEMEGALWTTAKNTFIHPEDVRVPTVKEVCRIEFAKALTTLEARLGDGPYVMGQMFTIADIFIGHSFGWAQVAKFDIPESGPLADYLTRLRERSGFQAAMAKLKEVS